VDVARHDPVPILDLRWLPLPSAVMSASPDQPTLGRPQRSAGGGQPGGGPGSPLPGYPPGAPGDIAEWWERWGGRLVDSLIFLVLVMFLDVGFYTFYGPSIRADGLAAAVAVGVPLLLTGLAYAGYDYVMHRRNGQTLGKVIFRTRLVAADGGPPSPSVLLNRAATYPGVVVVAGMLGFVAFGVGHLPYLLIVAFTLADGVFVITDTPLRRALHDRWAGTMVVQAS